MDAKSDANGREPGKRACVEMNWQPRGRELDVCWHVCEFLWNSFTRFTVFHGCLAKAYSTSMLNVLCLLPLVIVVIPRLSPCLCCSPAQCGSSVVMATEFQVEWLTSREAV